MWNYSSELTKKKRLIVSISYFMQKWTIIDFDYKRVCSSFLFDTVIAMMSFVSWDVEQSRKNHQRADECQHPFSQPYFHGIILTNNLFNFCQVHFARYCTFKWNDYIKTLVLCGFGWLALKALLMLLHQRLSNYISSHKRSSMSAISIQVKCPKTCQKPKHLTPPDLRQ